MKKVKYVGEQDALLTELHLEVKKGDVIDVPNDFENAMFVEEKNARHKEENK